MKAILLSALLLTGCVSQAQFAQPSDVSKRQFAEDKLTCSFYAKGSYVSGANGALVGGTRINNRLYNSCMETLGYRRLDERVE